MGKTVLDIAQIIEDSHYQDFRPADGFWTLDQFADFVISADATLKQNEYKDQVTLNLRKRTPNAEINLSSSNYVTEVVDIDKDGRAKLSCNIMMFPGASASLSVSKVKLEGNCGNVMPVGQNEIWEVCDIPNVVFCHIDKCGIKFINLEKNCNAKKVEVAYIPELKEESEIQEGRSWAIINMVTIFLKSAKDGVVVDMTANQNPNVLPQTEIDRYQLRP